MSSPIDALNAAGYETHFAFAVDGGPDVYAVTLPAPEPSELQPFPSDGLTYLPDTAEAVDGFLAQR